MTAKMKLSALALALISAHAAADTAQSGHGLSFFDNRLEITGTARVRADTGDINSQYTSVANPDRETASHLNLETWFNVRVWRDWKVKTMLEPQLNLKTGKMNTKHPDVPMKKLYAEGTVYGDWKARIGKYGAFSSYGRLLDNEVTGVEAIYTNPVMPSKIGVARVTKVLNDNAWGVKTHRDALVYAQTGFAVAPNVNVGGTVAYLKGIERQSGGTKSALMGEIGVDSQIIPDVKAMAAYSRTNIDDTVDSDGKRVSNSGVFAQVKYKEADWNVRNSYDLFLNARRVGAMSGVSSVEDYSKNVAGVQVGGDYVLWRNLKLNAFYLHGKQVNPTVAGGKKENVRVGRVQVEYKF